MAFNYFLFAYPLYTLLLARQDQSRSIALASWYRILVFDLLKYVRRISVSQVCRLQICLLSPQGIPPM